LREVAVLTIFWIPHILGADVFPRDPDISRKPGSLPFQESVAMRRLPARGKRKESENMRHVLFTTAAVVLLAAFSGCADDALHEPHFCIPSSACCAATCDGSGPMMRSERPVVRRSMPVVRQRQQQPPAVSPGPATVAYPYYTTRGPRDFLDRNPQSIGP